MYLVYFVVNPPHIPRPKVVRKADALAGVRICRAARVCGKEICGDRPRETLIFQGVCCGWLVRGEQIGFCYNMRMFRKV